MAWLTLTSAHVQASLAAAELTALRTTQLAVGQTDPLPEAITRTVGEVRGYVGAHAGGMVGQAGTIPEELLASAVAIARWRLLGRLPVKLMASEQRRQEYDDARALLRDVAAGKFAVSAPANPATDQPRLVAEGSWGSETPI